jgi:hypothetical protein
MDFRHYPELFPELKGEVRQAADPVTPRKMDR